jgi:hypothetical protein
MEAERATDGCWSISLAQDPSVLTSSFVGPTPTAQFPEFLAALSRVMPETPTTLVFDLRELDGYNPDTKEPMKAWLLAHKLSIGEIVVVVPKSKIFLKMVTAAIGLAVGVRIIIREETAEPRDATFVNP